MAKNMPKAPLIETLRELLHGMFRLREQGAVHSRMARSLGYADGYMQALIDAGLAEERELLHLVAEERTRANGPGSAEVVPEADTRAVA